MFFLSARPSWQRTCTEIGIKDSGEVKPFVHTQWFGFYRQTSTRIVQFTVF